MKECLSCHAQVQALQRRCPSCGGESFTYADFQEMLEAKQRAEEAVQLVNRGFQLYTQGHYAEAEKEYRRAIEINPMSDEAHNNMGVLLLQLGRPGEAIPWLEKAVELDPHDRETLEDLNLARERAKRGKGKQGRKGFSRR